MLCCPKSDFKWIRDEGRDGSDVKTQISDLGKCEFSCKFCSYCQESSKENSRFSIFEKVRVTVMQKAVHLKVHFDKKGKFWKICVTNFVTIRPYSLKKTKISRWF